MSGEMTGEFCRLSRECGDFLKKTAENMGLSPRSLHRILKVSRTIADLDKAKDISMSHISEATRYRFLDKPDLWML